MNAFKIDQLECAYKGGNSVLEVPHLEIPFGKIVVFLGPSGVGKSTLLETLGLMNHTIKSGKVKFANADKDFLSIWNHSQDEISAIRNQHMSFIFQENNLLENLTALENAMIPLLIQGIDPEIAYTEVMDWCKKMDLAFVNEKTSISELSVGQKQRLAFIRAISPSFSVLFGDEPTGNLDERNGWALMEALTKKIKSDPEKMVSIIVSHNIDLALKFADQIVVLTKVSPRKGGISEDHIFINNGEEWLANEEVWETVKLREHIAHLL